MGTEFRIAATALGGICLSLLLAAVSFRFIVPAILSARVYGSVIFATSAGLILTAAVIAFTAFWVAHVGRQIQLLITSDTAEEEKNESI